MYGAQYGEKSSTQYGAQYSDQYGNGAQDGNGDHPIGGPLDVECRS